MGEILLDYDEKEFVEITQNNVTIATPFVKWAGGKRYLVKKLISLMPSNFNDYYEPFVGGGALFFSIHKKLKKAYLSDFNFDLILTYRVIQDEPLKLIENLKTHEINHSKSYYYEIRTQYDLQDPLVRAARLIYLNKTCYNGLYRENKSKQFNVPMGQYKNPGIIQESNMKACHFALERAEIKYREFDQINPSKSDFVYFDPPYHPTDDNSFTGYIDANFTEKDQNRLFEFAKKLHKKGVFVMLSNSNAKLIKDLYSDTKIFNIHIVTAPRFVNCKADKRNPVEEVLITNY